MKNKALVRRPAQLVAALAALVLFSSCNRGYGCPNNFSLDVMDVLKATVQFFF
jgi:hypothetical protein